MRNEGPDPFEGMYAINFCKIINYINYIYVPFKSQKSFVCA